MNYYEEKHAFNQLREYQNRIYDYLKMNWDNHDSPLVKFTLEYEKNKIKELKELFEDNGFNHQAWECYKLIYRIENVQLMTEMEEKGLFPFMNIPEKVEEETECYYIQ